MYTSSFRNEAKCRLYNKWNPREFTATSPSLQEMTKGISSGWGEMMPNKSLALEERIHTSGNERYMGNISNYASFSSFWENQ